ncbi:hypothetical protein N7476_004712 [Penicillium atrosanguineum]|uniref:Uncharacterized protein n=1 Tax=Penicillium atrosanguineum TaxID=1132637 RepID=A0A9W9PYI5_9EURO|nr:hypothetical protein N7476_004712 [Penicillium atrosanguineum]
MSYDNPDQHPGYESQWSEIRDTKSPPVANLWSVPDHGTASEDADCDYEEDLSYVDESQAPIDNGNHNRVQDGYWVSGVHYDSGSAQDGASKPPENEIIAICTHLNDRVSGLEDQFLKQHTWNGNTQQGVEAIAQQHDEVGDLRDRVAMLEAKLNDLYKPKPGRPKRQVQ